MPPMDCPKAGHCSLNPSVPNAIYYMVENFLQYGNLAFGFSYVLSNSDCVGPGEVIDVPAMDSSMDSACFPLHVHRVASRDNVQGDS